MLRWKPNKMATGHETHKLGRQSSNDHNCQIWFTSLHWLWRKCNLTIFPLHVYGSFLLLWQPKKRYEKSPGSARHQEEEETDKTKNQKSNKRTRRTTISSLFPKRGNRSAKRTEKHTNKITQSKT